MPSEFDQFATAFAAPALQSHFGERDSDGMFTSGVYVRSDGHKIAIASLAVTQTAYVVDVDVESGELKRRETRKLVIETAMLSGVGQPAAGDKFVLQDGSEWAVDIDGTTWSESLVTIGLARKPLMRQWEARRAGV